MLTFFFFFFVFELMAFRLDSRASFRRGVDGSGRGRPAARCHRSLLKSTCSSSPGRKNGSTFGGNPRLKCVGSQRSDFPSTPAPPVDAAFTVTAGRKRQTLVFITTMSPLSFAVFHFVFCFFVLLLHCVRVCTVQILKCILTTIVT